MADLTLEPGSATVFHVYPTWGREHICSGVECWCEPHLYRICTQCSHDPECWACEGDGVIRIEVMTPGDRVIVVHHYVGDEEEIIDRT